MRVNEHRICSDHFVFLDQISLLRKANNVFTICRYFSFKRARYHTKTAKMMQMIHKMLDWFKSLFWKEEMELTLVGLQHAGKTTFVNVIASGQFNEVEDSQRSYQDNIEKYFDIQDMIPTVGFNMRKITKGNVTIKLWDIGGQPRFRSMWERYCRGVNAIVYMVDAADPDKIEVMSR